MTLNDFLKDHPGYGYLQVLVNDKGILTVLPSDKTNLEVDAVKGAQSRDPFSESTVELKMFSGPTGF